MKIELTQNPSKEDAKIISGGLVQFNHETIPDLEPQEATINFSIFTRAAAGEITGGLRASCYWNILHIELIWVSEEARGHDIGSQMVKKAEAFAIENGFELALLDTTSWQAKPFYEKLGYEVIATLPDHPKGHALHFLTKKLVA
ncbi:MAG: GNAT family N-acetyltransferase [Anaerolineae bacterium]|jgi:GNAT superfamily N-acetyltransferase|nr:GNAT family N-acetyltransferase [Anaerolineae bacterium]MBT7188707.1 GNAT family N-acetyltransferase [Anaerolineae bacterium]MBT7990950.1 GNAT family N-acetyltransferase [Anaerolineae bacterium]